VVVASIATYLQYSEPLGAPAVIRQSQAPCEETPGDGRGDDKLLRDLPDSRPI